MTKIIFMGTPAFSVPILEGLIARAEYEIVAVVTQPDRPVGRKRVLTPPPVKECALKHHIPIFQPEKIIGSEELDHLLALQSDVIVTAAFGQFLPEKLLSAPKFGGLNVHASLLPKYRGGAPVHYAIMNGEEKTGVTIMAMAKKMDAGDIYAQAEILIGTKDDVGTLFEKLSQLGKELLLETLPQILSGKIVPLPQDEKLVSFAPNISRAQEDILWSQTAAQIDCKVRGLRPAPVAYTDYQETRWKIFEVQVSAEKTLEQPGTIIEATKNSLKIAAGSETVLAIMSLQPAGKNSKNIQTFMSGMGQHLFVGERIGKI